MLHTRIRLDDLLGRDLSVQWYEGVAIVQSVCSRILADGDRIGFPSVGDILLGADGAIEVTGTSSPAGSVAAAGHTLSQTLGDDAPVRLRLVATQATGSDVAFQTLHELSQALAYFERPDAPAILRSLYERASTAAHRGSAPPAVIHTPATNEQEPQSRRTKGRTSRRLVMAGVAGAFACAAIWLFPLASHGPAAAIASLETAVRSTLGRHAVEESAEKKTETADGKAPVGKAPARRTGRRASSEAPREASAVNAWGFERFSVASGAEPLLKASGVPIPMLYETAPEGSTAPPTLTRTMYSATDSHVAPPRSVYPRLPANPPSAATLPDETVLEMVIGTTGLVERVRLRSEPRNIHEFMLVSAAKAWQFEPARLDGEPVRYLHTVVVSLR